MSSSVTYKPDKVNPLQWPRSTIRLWNPSRVLIQPSPFHWGYQCKPQLFPAHSPAPMISSQTHTLQIFLPHQDFPSNPNTLLHLRDFPIPCSISQSLFSKKDQKFRVLHVTPRPARTISLLAPARTSGKSFLSTLPQLSYHALCQTSVSFITTPFHLTWLHSKAAVQACTELRYCQSKRKHRTKFYSAFFLHTQKAVPCWGKRP